jgi:outer membrane protein assembly factor BamB
MGGHGQREKARREAGDTAAAGPFAVTEVDALLAFVARRTRYPRLAADVTAETLAAALVERGAGAPERDASATALRAIAIAKLADARRRGAADDSARRRLGLGPVDLTDADVARIDARRAGHPAALWVVRPAPGAERPTEPTAVPDFAVRLCGRLREATVRSRRRSRRRRAAAGVLGVGAVAALATVVSAVLETGTARPAPGPRVVANVAVADGVGRTARVAFGSVWLSATNDAAVLRVDPRTRRVVARIPVGTDVNLGAGAGAVWAVPRRPSRARARLIRIDPRTNRVVARIPLPSPGARYPLGGAAVVAGTRVWVVGAQNLVALDPATNRPVRQVVLGGDFLVVDSMLRGRELWIIRADRSITRFDAVSGLRLGRQGWEAPSEFLLPDGNRLVKVGRRSVALVDPVGGHTIWLTRLGTQLNDAAIVGGRLLVEGADSARSRDTLWELDPRTGRLVGDVTVPGFSVTAVLRVGRDAWIVTADGHVIVVAP